MHKSGVVRPLLGLASALLFPKLPLIRLNSLAEMVGSVDVVLQEAAGSCLGNIRRLALANEKARAANA